MNLGTFVDGVHRATGFPVEMNEDKGMIPLKVNNLFPIMSSEIHRSSTA
ncbi:hypothetical protein [Erwinia tasmaniensis]|nr:hypothetical protein [Erwinia tasmaniensis]